jgi:hypothetical protein
MGYRYGEHRYSEGRYSRWPDWWHEKTCAVDTWEVQACKPPAWTPVEKDKPLWIGMRAQVRRVRRRG